MLVSLVSVFLRVVHMLQISFPDLANYDSTEAWPLILDNFVYWMKETQAALKEELNS